MSPSRLPRILPALLAALLLVAPAPAQDAAPASGHVDTILGQPEAPAAAAAAVQLASTAESAVALQAIRTAWGEKAPSGIAAAMLVGVGIAHGDKAFESQAENILKHGKPEEKSALLAPLVHSREKSLVIESFLDHLAADSDPQVKAAALAVQAHYQEVGKSSGIGLFLVLIVLAVIGGAVHLVRSAGDLETDSDKLKDWVDLWTDKPMDRQKTLADIRGVENVVPQLLALFEASARLNSTQVVALLDILSFFDVDPVHEKLYEFAGHSNDQVKKAAILSMHRLGDDAWVGVLADYVRGEDEVARYAGAMALANRGAVDHIDFLRGEMERTRLGSVRDGIEEAIMKLEAKAQQG